MPDDPIQLRLDEYSYVQTHDDDGNEEVSEETSEETDEES